MNHSSRSSNHSMPHSRVASPCPCSSNDRDTGVPGSRRHGFIGPMQLGEHVMARANPPFIELQRAAQARASFTSKFAHGSKDCRPGFLNPNRRQNHHLNRPTTCADRRISVGLGDDHPPSSWMSRRRDGHREEIPASSDPHRAGSFRREAIDIRAQHRCLTVTQAAGGIIKSRRCDHAGGGLLRATDSLDRFGSASVE